MSFAGERGGAAASAAPLPDKQAPNYAPSGLLAAETNTVAGTDIMLKYHEPPEARKAPASTAAWRLYVFGHREAKVAPYIIDLDSANGTSVNGDRIPDRRFVELRNKDLIRFGLSTREYVLMLPP